MIKRKTWLYTFSENKFPSWNCPSCEDGILKPVEGTFRYWKKVESFDENFLEENRMLLDEDEFRSVVFDVYCYSVVLKCGNCSGQVSSCGSGNVIERYIPETGDSLDENMFYPKFFYPAINIFSLPKKCPQQVVAQIKSSFSIFLLDPPAAANYLRKAVEEILTNKKVKRFVLAKNSRRFSISLHNRIVEFEKSNPKIAQKLMAIKWIGNEGSHTNSVTTDDVLDAYEILKLVIDELYGGYQKSIEEKISKINKTKKPLRLITS